MDDQKISFNQLIEARKQEMQSMLPGLMTEVTDGEHIVMVCSPDPCEKSKFKMNLD